MEFKNWNLYIPDKITNSPNLDTLFHSFSGILIFAKLGDLSLFYLEALWPLNNFWGANL
jgi:hypothetical protein